MLEQLRKIRDAGSITRFHTARVIKEETVAQHSYGVATIVLTLTRGTASRDLIIAALLHDLGEAAIGDIPSPVKASLPQETQDAMEKMETDAIMDMFPRLAEDMSLEPEDVHTLHVADRMDGLMKCIEELQMGNRHIVPIGMRYCQYLLDITDEAPTYQHEVNELIFEFRGSL